MTGLAALAEKAATHRIFERRHQDLTYMSDVLESWAGELLKLLFGRKIASLLALRDFLVSLLTMIHSNLRLFVCRHVSPFLFLRSFHLHQSPLRSREGEIKTKKDDYRIGTGHDLSHPQRFAFHHVWCRFHSGCGQYCTDKATSR